MRLTEPLSLVPPLPCWPVPPLPEESTYTKDKEESVTRGWESLLIDAALRLHSTRQNILEHGKPAFKTQFHRQQHIQTLRFLFLFVREYIARYPKALCNKGAPLLSEESGLDDLASSAGRASAVPAGATGACGSERKTGRHVLTSKTFMAQSEVYMRNVV